MSVIDVPFFKCSPITYQAFKETSLVFGYVLNHKLFKWKVFAFIPFVVWKFKCIEVIVAMRLFVAADFLKVYFSIFSCTKDQLLHLFV